MSTPHVEFNPIQYVLGFAFMPSGHPCVVLIKKTKPDWQKGLLNGVGGKLEVGEPIRAGMVREFFEETGVQTSINDWYHFHSMRFGNGATVHVLTARLKDEDRPQTMEEEQVHPYLLSPFAEWYQNEVPIIRNLRWLIPMAWHQLQEPAGERMIP